MALNFLGLDHPLLLVDGFQGQLPGPCGEEFVQATPWGILNLIQFAHQLRASGPSHLLLLQHPLSVESLPLYLAQGLLGSLDLW